MDGNAYQKASSNNSGRLFIGHDMHSSHLPMKRALPSSLQPSTSNVRPNNLVENVGPSDIRETYGKSYQSPSNGMNSMKENPIWGSENDPSFFEKRGNRQLPLSLMAAKHSSHTPYGGQNDSFHHSGIGEERPAGADERFVFQAAVQVLVCAFLRFLCSLGLSSIVQSVVK